MTAHYNRTEFAEALAKVGLRKGDVVFSHSSIGFFGYPEEGRERDTVCEVIFRAFFDVLGDEGTLAVPTFTYSFCKGEPYLPEHTPSTSGIFTEWLRRRVDAKRSLDPIFSVAAVGGQAACMTNNTPRECFGENSFWDRLHAAGGRICNLNLNAGFNTFLHYAECKADAHYRMHKLFTGTIIQGGRTWEATADFFCQSPDHPYADYDLFAALAEEQGLVRKARVGRGMIVCIDAADALDFFLTRYAGDKHFLHPEVKERACP